MSFYASPPPGYGMPYDHRSPPMSPGPGAYYSARGYAGAMPTPRMSSSKMHGHARRASHAVPTQSQYAPGAGRPAMPSHNDFNSSRYQTPRATPDYDYVSRGFDYGPRDFDHSYGSGYAHGYGPGYAHVRPRSRRDTDAACKRPPREKKRRPSESVRYVHAVFDGYGFAYDEAVYGHPPPPYQQHARHEWDADRYVYDQVPIYESDPKTARPRRASHSTRGPQPAPKQRSSPKPAVKATEEDARRAGIPTGYSYKNWDPTEEPIMLLGSVFDANSLGKWIYDWTVFHYGPATPIAEMAGELWLLLIQLAGKVKRAEENMDKIRKKENAEMVEDFLESGERLWIRFAKLLKVCEDYMWKAAKKESGEKKPIAMGKNSGREFVESIFGRDRELERTEKLMTGMRLWSMRFDANCEDILRYPSA